MAHRQYEDTLEVVYQGSSASAGQVTRTFSLTGEGDTATLSASTESLNFGAVSPRTSRTLRITLTNTGRVPVELQNLTLNDDVYFKAALEGASDSKVIPVHGSRDVLVTFSPQDTSTLSAELSITLWNEAQPLPRIRLSGIGAYAMAQLTPSPVYFNTVPRGAPTTLPVTLRNIGTATLTVSNVIPNAPFSARPSQGTWPIDIVAGESRTIDVTFTPEVEGPVERQLTIISNSQGASNVQLTAVGTGTLPVLNLPGGTAIDFAAQVQNQESPPRDLVIKNTGLAPLELYAINSPNNFCIYATDPNGGTACPHSISGGTLQPQESAIFKLTARPTEVRAIVETLSISSNAATSPNLVTLSVNGTGGVTTASTSVDFGACNLGALVERQISITNTGLTGDEVTALELDPANSPWGSEFSAQLPLVIPNDGRSVPLTLRFHPRGNEVSQRRLTAHLRTRSGQTLTLTLQGTGTSSGLRVERTDELPFNYALDFGGVRTGTSSALVRLRLTHTGAPLGGGDAGTVAAAPVTLRSMSLEGADNASFSLGTPSLPFTLQPGGSTELTVQFIPGAEKRGFSAALRITSDAAGAPSQVVRLSGEGRDHLLFLSPANLDFGAQVAQANTKVTLPVDITNTSIQPIDITGIAIVGTADGAQSEPSHFEATSARGTRFTLQPRQSAQVGVAFTPRADITSKAALEFTSSDVSSPVARVNLAGKGLSTMFRDLSRTVDFGTVRRSVLISRKLVLTNDSTRSIVLRAATPEGAQAHHFHVIAPAFDAAGRTLAPSESVTLEIRYDTAQVATSEATLVLAVDDQPRAAQVALKGVTVENFLEAIPTSVDFGWGDMGVPSEPTRITLTNKSDATMRVSDVKVTNPAFELSAVNLPLELAPGEETTLSVTFRPQAGGPMTGEIQLFLQDPQSPALTIELHGQGRTLESEGGGCGCGAGGGGSALLGLVGLAALRMQRRRRP
ncbi:choice-of-anchor D domain-containing protein [Myxococcus hansupus]|uniref:choice-of-anchor D domain-containing protein n=1 Tax=Pseudomyxococcus hansupus TaxID=1297742 RepID=UPI0006767420|nr:choice-of-anchor D domain-containing protein [Myxococcus hansupus]